MKCKECGSHAINRHLHGRDGSDLDLCDVCYWRKRANAIQRPGCVATAHWGACDTCRYNDSKYGCVIKEKIPLSLENTEFIICDEYESR